MARMIDSQNYYQILEVEENATHDEIHRAYMKARETYSNNNPALYTVFTKEEAIELLKLIDEAYRVLSNMESRTKYDYQLQKERDDSPAVGTAPTPITKTAEPIPEGYAKTSLSKYKIDDDFEEKIHTSTEFSGEFLKQIREYKNIKIEALSEHTRISRTYLNALETENFSNLPATVFVRGFVAQLAKIYNLNEKIVADSYIQRYKEHVGN